MDYNNNVVKIGTALKWRNTFDLTKKYYQENVVTACGCVFRCKVLQAQGKSPIRMTDDQGHIVYTNTDVWDVLVDMAYYYNYAVDTRKLTQQMLDYAKKLDEAFQKQQKEIAALQKDNKDQWNHINDIEKVNAEQQRELNSILDTISCFSEGIWIDTLLWSNETIWDNNKFAITDDLQNQINVLSDTHRQDIKDLTDKHDSEISALAAHVVRQEKIQDGINTYLQDQIYDLNNAFCCFNTGVWENDLHWGQEALWDNNKYAVTDAIAKNIEELTNSHQTDVKNISKRLDDYNKAFNEAVTENTRLHGLVNEHLQKHDKEIGHLQDLILEHDQQIIDLLDALCCFSNGQWDNNLKWSEQHLWGNSNQTLDTFNVIYIQIDKHQKAIDDLSKKIDEINRESAAYLIEELRKEEIAEHRKIAYQIRAISREQVAQDDNIFKIGEHFSCYADGIWGDLFIWDNNQLWANQTGVVSEALDDLSNDLRDTRYQLNEANEDIRTNLSLIQTNHRLIESNTIAIQDNKNAISTTQSKLQATTDEIRNEALAEHRSVAYQLRAIAREQAIQDENTAKIGEHFSCFADGVWGGLFVWGNEQLWANQPGVINRALEDIKNDIQANSENIQKNEQAIQDCNTKLNKSVAELKQEALTEHRTVAYQFRATAREQIVQDDNIAKIGEHFGCFVDGQWGNLFIWNNNHLWSNETNVIKNRLDNLDNEVSDIQKSLSEVIEEAASHFDCIDDGVWNNLSYWDNSAFWRNGKNEVGELYSLHRSEIQTISDHLKSVDSNIETLVESLSKMSDSQESKILSMQEDIQSNAQKIKDNRQDIDNNYSEINGKIDDLQKEQTDEQRQLAYQIRAINREQANQNEQIVKIGEHFGCFVNGQWGDLFLWDNTHLWSNEVGVIDREFADIKGDISDITRNIVHATEEMSERFNCYENGNWHNASLWQNTSIWQNGVEEIKELFDKVVALENKHSADNQKCNQQITGIQQSIDDLDKNISDTKKLVSANSSAISTLQTEHQKDIETLCQKVQRQNETTNSEISQIKKRQDTQEEDIDYLYNSSGCFENGKWNSMLSWSNTDLWLNSPQTISEIETDVINHETRLSALESQFALFMQQFMVAQTIIEEQKSQLEALMDCFTVLNVGKWQNSLLWDNNSLWSNSLITEQSASSGNTSSSVSVKSYDPNTLTVTL